MIIICNINTELQLKIYLQSVSDIIASKTLFIFFFWSVYEIFHYVKRYLNQVKMHLRIGRVFVDFTKYIRATVPASKLSRFPISTNVSKGSTFTFSSEPPGLPTTFLYFPWLWIYKQWSSSIYKGEENHYTAKISLEYRLQHKELKHKQITISNVYNFV